ncbi:hypothetical protein [Litoribacter populi]|uniref:hypothetical protein n=1 Tax=Litoribacter populi TaxID=2598460 RepID=UPI00117C6B42|nr:hypothetical protein [Litoribacter populi]
MQFIYEKVLAKLQEIPELRWIDLDKGQLDSYETRPNVNFPCALISMQLPRCEDLGAKKQQCTALVTIRLGFDFSGNTSSVTPEAERAKSLAYFDLCEKVYQKLQGWNDENINKFSRQNFREERRGDNYKVVAIPFSSGFLDFSAAM